MRHWSRAAVAVAMGVLLAPIALQAQGVGFSLGGGIGIPLGAFDDAVKIGWQGTAAVSFAPPRMPVIFQIDGAFSRFSDESTLDIKSQMIYGTANVLYKFQSSGVTRLRPYVSAGLGVYNSKETGSDAIGGSSTKFGLNAGAGCDFKAGSTGLFVEGRFHDVFTDGPNVKFIPINIGIRFGGS